MNPHISRSWRPTFLQRHPNASVSPGAKDIAAAMAPISTIPAVGHFSYNSDLLGLCELNHPAAKDVFLCIPANQGQHDNSSIFHTTACSNSSMPRMMPHFFYAEARSGHRKILCSSHTMPLHGTIHCGRIGHTRTANATNIGEIYYLGPSSLF